MCRARRPEQGAVLQGLRQLLVARQVKCRTPNSSGTDRRTKPPEWLSDITPQEFLRLACHLPQV